MGIAEKPAGVKLFIALLYHPSAPVHDIFQQLDKRFGPRQFSLGPVPFSWTDYYGEEMGQPLEKIYFSYETSIQREDLPAIKNFTNDLEAQSALADGSRRVNIDPGYVTRDKVVLATTKDFYHRLYLADGIFAEVTLHYRKGKFRYFSWTYPDFRNYDTMHFLEKVRAPLIKELRQKPTPLN